MELILFDELIITIPKSYWDYMVTYRFGGDNPSYEEIQAEFVSGTGITASKRALWNEANRRFLEYIEDLMNISKMDVNAGCCLLIDRRK